MATDPTHKDNFWTVDKGGAVMNVHIDVAKLGDWRQFRMDGSIKPEGTDPVTLKSISNGDLSMTNYSPTCTYKVKFNGVANDATLNISPGFQTDSGVTCTQQGTSVMCSE